MSDLSGTGLLSDLIKALNDAQSDGYTEYEIYILKDVENEFAELKLQKIIKETERTRASEYRVIVSTSYYSIVL